MGRLSTDLCGIPLSNPVIAASGTFGYGAEFSGIYDLDILGGISFKGTTLKPRTGNPSPRIAEAPGGIINSVGLQNPGAESVIRDEIPRLAESFHKPIIANLCGFSVDEYMALGEMFNEIPEIAWYEVNISCPNVHGGGMSFGTDAGLAAEVTRSVRKVTDKKVIMKLSPNVSDISEIARACEAAGADGLSLINTLRAMRIDLVHARPILGNITGGLSGPAILPVALSMVYEVYNAVKIPIVGIGGISSARDVIEMMMAGAVCVEIGSAGLKDPMVLPGIIEELPARMDELKIDKITDIVGAAH